MPATEPEAQGADTPAEDIQLPEVVAHSADEDGLPSFCVVAQGPVR